MIGNPGMLYDQFSMLVYTALAWRVFFQCKLQKLYGANYLNLVIDDFKHLDIIKTTRMLWIQEIII